MLRKIGGRCAEHPPDLKQRAFNQRLRARTEYLQGHIVAFVDRIHRHVAHRDVQFDVRVLGAEVLERQSQVTQCETGQHLQPQYPRRRGFHRAHVFHGRIQPRDDVRTLLEKIVAGLGQHHGPRGAVKQRRLNIRFQLFHPACDDRGGDVELAGGLHKALGFGHPYECLHTEKFVHVLCLSLAT